jgi:hypothetical protein
MSAAEIAVGLAARPIQGMRVEGLSRSRKRMARLHCHR